MELLAALEVMRVNISEDLRHPDYDRVKDLADTYKKLITGKGIATLLIQIIQREDKAAFDQRCRITKAITPAVAASLRTPFQKVTRNDRVRKALEIKNQSKADIIKQMEQEFYGAKRKKTRGLEYWLKTRFLSLTFSDPNAWVVAEWVGPKTAAEVIKPRPFEVRASWATNFQIINDETKWLIVRQPIKYKAVDGPPAGVNVGNTAQKTVRKDGYRWTMYDEDVTVVFQQIDSKALEAADMPAGSQVEKVGEVEYLVTTFTPNVGYVPAYRVGYKADEETDGRTFVNPWHDAMCYFEKSLKTVSEMDLTMALHVFPQKIQYVSKCQGTTKEKKCNRGWCNDGSVCASCKGTGIKVHTSAQDAVLLPMPDDPKEMIDLEKIMVYKGAPIDTVKFQNEYILQLERQCHSAVFNSQVFIKSNGPTDQSGVPIQTATENNNNMESVYDALEPFTEKISEFYREFITLFAVLAGENNVEEIKVTHEFPADFKLKSVGYLLTERKQATDSGAPPFLMQSIDDDIAVINYTGDELGLRKYQVKREYYPFGGKTPDEIAMLLSSQYVPKEPKVLYCNFDEIFKEIEQEHPEVWTMGVDKKKTRDEWVTKKIADYMAKLDAQTPKISLDLFGNGGGGSGGGGNDNGGAGNQNPGENNNGGDAGNNNAGN